ncbi:MAG: ribulose-phosphate 3-epimerase [Ruminococcus sp.]|nr:ribulose-phosphate 3-epimerase [Ruminococcus sp.]
MNSDLLVSASLLGCDLSNLENEINRAQDAGADWLHFDVMDGIFVPNISFGQPVLKAVKKCASVPIDTHLMIKDPIRYVEEFAKAGSHMITFHIEATREPLMVIDRIRSSGAKAGISVKPGTPVGMIKELVPYVDMVLIMTVEPGFGGQGFIHETLKKVSMVKALAESAGKKIHIEVDGGINSKTAAECRNAGADVFVSGTFLFNSQDMSKAVASIKGL